MYLTATYETLQECLGLVWDACVRLKIDVPYLEWGSYRLSRSIGRYWRWGRRCEGKPLIELSPFFWPHLEPSERRNALLHEVAHHLHYRTGWGGATHGRQWRAAAREVGAYPRRYTPFSEETNQRMTNARFRKTARTAGWDAPEAPAREKAWVAANLSPERKTKI